jgi:hypothetical protein
MRRHYEATDQIIINYIVPNRDSEFNDKVNFEEGCQKVLSRVEKKE